VKKKIWANLLFTFYPKIVIKLSKKDVWDPGSKRHQISRILNTVSTVSASFMVLRQHISVQSSSSNSFCHCVNIPDPSDPKPIASRIRFFSWVQVFNLSGIKFKPIHV
jgi:hypothetical protein